MPLPFMKRILIVDDSETARRFHADALASAGLAVRTAATGAEAIEMLFLEPFDLILTDINMPVMDGYEFSQRVRSERRFDAVPIVFISTEAGDADKIRGFAAGGNLYLVKPVDPEILVEQILMIAG